jgi:intron-binding protein aquarius
MDVPHTVAASHDNDPSLRRVHQRAHTLQKLLHRHHAGEASEVIFAGVGRVCDPKWLRGKVDIWSETTLYDVCHRLRLVDDDEEDTSSIAGRLGCTRRELLTSVLLYHHSSRPSYATILSSAPLYPTEALLWDANSVPPGDARLLGPGGGRSSLSLSKLNARFLSPGDYLLRNFRLFRLESAYEIRGDIVDVVRRMRPARMQDGYVNDDGDYYGGNRRADAAADGDEGSKTEFQGWARMGLELGSKKRNKPGVRLMRVDPPRLGESVPSQVIAEVVLDLHSCATSLAKEWDEIGEFDNLFLVCVDATVATGDAPPSMGATGKHGEERRIPDEEDCSFPLRYGVRAVRGCMVLEVRDEAGTLLSDPASAHEGGGAPTPKGKLRFLRVALDPAQYALDAAGDGSVLGVNVYETLNLVVRRSGRENNFKSVLETIRSLMKGGANSIFRSIPSWLMPVLLGYGGDPTMASYSSSKMKSFASKTTGVTPPHAALDYGDTFLNVTHLRESFAGCELTVDGMEVTNDYYETEANMSERKKYRVKVVDDKGQNKVKVVATSYPFPPSYTGNDIRFTPVQVSAIRSGLSPGLTTIIGPPGTGKTDVAVQIIANLYHSFPTQRTVIVTHSNAALNGESDIFLPIKSACCHAMFFH